MTNGKTVLILGGGIGGVVAARRLRQWLPRAHRVVLVEREVEFAFQSSFLWLMTGRRERAAITRPLARLEAHGIEVVRGEIEAIDPSRRVTRVQGRELAGDALILALGAELAPETIPGLEQAGFNQGFSLYTLGGLERLRAARLDPAIRRIAVLVCAAPFKCPAAPYEAALLLEDDCRRRGVRETVAIDLYTPEAGPMLTAGEESSRQVRQLVESRGISYHPGHGVVGVDAAGKTLHFADGGEAGYNLLAYVPPHRAPTCVREADLCGAGGWVEVDRATLATRFPGVYAIGDVTGIPLAIGKPLPKAGVFAQAQAETVARNLADRFNGRPESARFDGHGACFLEAGAGRAGFGRGDFYAEPAPAVQFQPPARPWHWAKAAYEKYWLYKWLR